MKLKLVSGLRDHEAKPRPVVGIKIKPAMTLSEMTERLLFRSEAMAFASFSPGNIPVTAKEEVGYNFKKTFRKPSENFTGSKGNGHICNRCGGEPQ